MLAPLVFALLIAQSTTAFALARVPFPSNTLQPIPTSVAPNVSGNVNSSVQQAYVPPTEDSQGYGTDDQDAAASDTSESNTTPATAGGFPWIDIVGAVVMITVIAAVGFLLLR